MAAEAGRRWLWLALLCGLAVALEAEEQDSAAPKARKKKDIRDYNDADMARLLEQWEKDDDIEEGDLPEHKRPSAPIDFSKIDPSKPESVLKMTKKGKTLMMFVTVSGDPTEKETEQITNLWQGSLFNANYDVQRDSLEDSVSEAPLVNHFPMVPIHHNYLDTIFRERELLAVNLQEQKAFPDQRFMAPVYQNMQKNNNNVKQKKDVEQTLTEI